MDNGASSYRRFLEGDDSGIAEIVTEYKDGLIIYLNSYVNNINIAEDLMVDTFFKLMLKKPPFFKRYSFKTWLYTIGRHIAVDYLRKQSKHTNEPIENYETSIADAENLESLYFKEERKIIVHKTLGNLKSEYRDVLFLIYFEGLTNQEAGKIMNKNKSQTEMLLYRAKKSLKSELEKEGFVYEEF